ncbi:MAG TPA: hypothetical protein VFZ65_17660 [Planctomycetota bacterium]|nr:hypothetical protein [Planctomycetota bacterium]
MRPRLHILFAMLPGAVLAAQQRAAAPPAAAVLEQQFLEAQRAWNEALRRTEDAAAVAELRQRRPEAAFVPRFEAGAQAFAGTAAAVPYLVWIVAHDSQDAAFAAMSTLMQEHVADPGIGRAVARIGGLHHVFGPERSRAWLDRVFERNEDAAVLHQAHYTRAAMYVGTRAVERSEPLRQLAITDLGVVLAAAESDSLRKLAKGLLHEAQVLEPGLPAPDITGEDLDGVPFRLADYKGKVVLLDFWGDW